MNHHPIKNFTKLATSSLREKALLILEEGLTAVKTDQVIKNNLKLSGKILKIKNLSYDLSTFNKIYVIGIGKAAAESVVALDRILGKNITAGIIIDIKTTKISNPKIAVFKGTHPKASVANIQATLKVIQLTQKIQPDDLVICIISGGGSALLCATTEELNYGSLIYDQFVQQGGNINELNTLRKHISTLKGGGLAKLLYPAQVISLIFSDIPDGEIEDVASGPTFFDKTTLNDVDKIIQKQQLKLPAELYFTETLKDKNIFKNIKNILLVSNIQAVEAMVRKSIEFGFNTAIYSTKIMDKIPQLAEHFNSNINPNSACIGAGEPELVIHNHTLGKGGRSQQLALESAKYLQDKQLQPEVCFISLASDGIDNSEAAGAIVDNQTLSKMDKLKLNYEKQKNGLNSFEVFEKLGDLIFTGPTGTNVGDLILRIKK